ncbi:MAG: phosphate signaling complex protein PhoU [Spiroplasma sp. WSS]|uniref:phosphate signaling complex protein PhoU n=1 Tax=unclassified Spiroplasma TaxID=2637901 RepID=UPI0012273E5B|nr:MULTISPECIES: phosphate signaling complex protein PhoU [unclassified Spiroplasma]MBP1525491.1 phosphate signaling complex protein PhoU [Spiroplasma ixodetis]TLF27673.1 MAG: phosphate signaling complex protein PhoU [Spiroplasma sp. WSS]MBP1526963.1 phosphate signaling complex protein PhoU [Spiroplasma ixodetis]MBP1528159.1 phosphate signaling complex protein PhoU [Spiroplasma ixodetis]CAB1054349.1 Phosphate transport system regulatory protein PhoU [Spiroplasma endosymbiont of Danaus chrysipp
MKIINRRFDLDIINLKQNLLTLLKEVKKEHKDALIAMETQDFDMSKRIVETDKEIRTVAESLTITAIWSIAQQNPFATDLRTIIGYMNIIRDLERISNYAKNLSKFNVKYKPEIKLTSQLSGLMKKVFKMMDLIGESINENDINKAYQAAEYDIDIDNRFRESMKNIVNMLKVNKNNDQLSQYTSTMQQLKYIERLGDHLVNICETIVYIIKGKFYDLSSTKISE